MRKRVFMVLAILFVAVLGLIGWRHSGDGDLVYRGKPFGKWLDDLNSSSPEIRASAADAIRQIGTNAIPSLLQEASRTGSLPRELLSDLLKRQSVVKFRLESTSDYQSKALRGFRALGKTGALGLAEGFTNNNQWIRFGCVGQWEMCSDYPAILFQPLFSRLKDNEPMIRSRAANALGMLHQQPELVVPALTQILNDPVEEVRCGAALGLSLYGDKAKSAAPAILALLTNSSAGFYFWGTNALKAIDPAAAAKAGIK